MSKTNVIVVSPHPDDMEIGMGGTVCRLIEEGKEVVSIVVTDGRRSTTLEPLSEDEVVMTRQGELFKAAKILGVEKVNCLRLADVQEDDNKAAFKEVITPLLKSYDPCEIYIPHPEFDKHPTHRSVAELIIETVWEGGLKERDFVDNIFCYEVWSAFPFYDKLVDITAYVDRKRASIAAHKSQIAYKSYDDGILGLNRYRAVFGETGGVTEMDYAEVFIRLQL